MDTVTVDDLVVGFREATAADEGIVFNAWLKGHRQLGDWPKRLSSRRYFDEHKLVVAQILARATTVVACNAARPTQVLGFVCFEDGVLHWLFVKQPYRRQGIARHLMRQGGYIGPDTNPIACSHWTITAQDISRRWPLRYNPFLLEAVQ